MSEPVKELDRVCIRPDGKVCLHEEERHSTAPHPLFRGPWGCMSCWLADGMPVLGPYVHAYSPHVLTMAGYLPTEEEDA